MVRQQKRLAMGVRLDVLWRTIVRRHCFVIFSVCPIASNPLISVLTFILLEDNWNITYL